MSECPTRGEAWEKILSADADPTERSKAIAHALGGCEECKLHLEAAGAELDSLLSVACVRDLPCDEHEPLSAEERDAVFAVVIECVLPGEGAEAGVVARRTPTWPEAEVSIPDEEIGLGRTITRPETDSAPAVPGWRYALTAAMSLAAITAAVVVLFMMMPAGHVPADGAAGELDEAAVVAGAELTLHTGSYDEHGQPLVGDAIADGAEVEAGDVLLFRVTTSCAGYPYLVIERENRAPDVIWHWETKDYAPGEWTLESQGMAIGLSTFGESGKLVLHLLLEPDLRSLYTARSLLETALEPHPKGECWARDSVTVHVRPPAAP